MLYTFEPLLDIRNITLKNLMFFKLMVCLRLRSAMNNKFVLYRDSLERMGQTYYHFRVATTTSNHPTCGCLRQISSISKNVLL
ncbi:MAG: hypothetical protein FWC41_13085 [Firmicutes bacterium]|nr:hypothetical protein [Bacillota bacterium]